MDPELLQHVVVTVVALGAAAVIVWRVAGVVRTPKGDSKCSSCPSAAAPLRHPRQEFPLNLVRKTPGTE